MSAAVSDLFPAVQFRWLKVGEVFDLLTNWSLYKIGFSKESPDQPQSMNFAIAFCP